MDVQEALADLTEISAQVGAAVVLDEDGAILGSTVPDGAAEELARAVGDLLAAAAAVRSGAEAPLTQLEAATRGGSVFVVRGEGRTIAATTGPSPTAGLVFYDLKTCLRALGDATAAAPDTAAEGGGAAR